MKKKEEKEEESKKSQSSLWCEHRSTRKRKKNVFSISILFSISIFNERLDPFPFTSLISFYFTLMTNPDERFAPIR